MEDCSIMISNIGSFIDKVNVKKHWRRQIEKVRTWNFSSKLLAATKYKSLCMYVPPSVRLSMEMFSKKISPILILYLGGFNVFLGLTGS